MSELIIGNGFIGQAMNEAFVSMGRDVHQASRRPKLPSRNHFVDLNQPESVASVLDVVKPDVIINCAAVVRNNGSGQVDANPIFARNLLEGVRMSGLQPSRIVTLGSAAEYGPVNNADLPIKEDAERNPNSAYGMSKKDEIDTALEISQKHGVPLVAARVFNPLGPGLHPSNLTSAILGQMQEIRSGNQKPHIEVRNLSVERDYVHIADCVSAIGSLALAEDLPFTVYNVGSGVRTSNETLIQLALDHAGMQDVTVSATDTKPEPLVGAAQADMSRLSELGWKPAYSLDDTVAHLIRSAGLMSEMPDVA
jgi:nucleoside-diphosphate-sugar epimerase